MTREAAIGVAKEDLRKRGIDPAAKKMVISKELESEAFFRDKPKDAHWDDGRLKVGKASFYMVTFTEPKMTRGGSHQYFFEVGTHRWLWTTRGK